MYTDAEYQRGPEFNWSRIDQISNSATEDAFASWNFRADWREALGSKLGVAVYVNNLTDEEIIVGGCNNVGNFGLAETTLGPPRTCGAEVRWHF